MKTKAFSLIEIILVIALMAIVAQLSIPAFMSMKTRNDFDLAETQVLQGLRRAKALAMAGTNDSNWGVYFSEKTFTIYCGNDFSTRDAARDEATTVNINISLPDQTDVNFEKNTGALDQSTSLTISDSSVTDNITITESGLIDY